MSVTALSRSTDRTHIHTRRIELAGYLRADGLWDIEAHLVDTKTYGFSTSERGRIEIGDPVHDMWLRVTVDDGFTVRDIEASTVAAPFHICPAITGNFKRLIGLTMGKGWNAAIRDRVGGVEGCTHHVELLGPLATVAFQSIVPYRDRLAREKAEAGSPRTTLRPPSIIDTCHAFAADGDVVKRLWPEFYTGSTVRSATKLDDGTGG